MLKTTSEVARAEFRKARRENDVAHAYISFIHRNFPEEEANQYTMAEWQRLAQLLEIEYLKVGKRELIQRIREESPDYKEVLRGV